MTSVQGRLWFSISLALAFVVSGLLGYGFRARALEPRAVAPVASCQGRLDLPAVTELARSQLEQMLTGSAPAPASSARNNSTDTGVAAAVDGWTEAEQWADRLAQVEQRLLRLHEDPTFDSLESLHDVLGLELAQCSDGDGRWPDDDAVAELSRTPHAPLFDRAWVARAADAGCRAHLTRIVDVAIESDARLTSALAVAASLRELGEAAAPELRLIQLRTLHTRLRDVPESVWREPIDDTTARAQLHDEALLSLSRRLSSSSLLEQSCLPESPQAMRTVIAETFHERMGATGLFSHDEVGWRVLPELVRVQAILEAFFELSFIQRVSPQKCSLSEALSAARWDPAALEIVRGALSEYRSTGLLSRLSTLTQRKDDVVFPAVWAALTPAGCAKITQNLCVELNATLKPMDTGATSVLTNLRQQAASLEQTDEVWADVRRHAEQFGCQAGVFGLDAVEQFATQVLAGAEAELGKVTADALEEVKTLIENPEEPKTALVSRDPAARLVLYRREVAALTRGVALPALAQLETKEAASDEVEQWQRLVFDLTSPEAVRAGGAPASAGRSGLFAFERFYADVLSRGVHACTVPFDSWRTGVFAVGERGFYERGRAFAAEVERVCALGKHKRSAG